MYLRTRDYDRFIQADNLSQVLSLDSSIRLLAESASQEEVISYLVQKYDVAAEFTDTNIFSFSATYNAWNRAELNFPAYDATLTYTVGNIVSNGTSQYICSTTISVPEAFNPGHWRLVGSQYDLVYVSYPYPLFNVYSTYSVGDIVFWKNKIYKALQASPSVDHQTFLNAGTYAGLKNYLNTFPDDPVNGPVVWGTGIAFSVTGLYPNAAPADFTAWSNVTAYVVGNRVNYLNQIWQCIRNNTNVAPGTDITAWQPIKWTLGDNRSQQIMKVMIDITLFHLHSRIAPRNIPQLRINSYMGAEEDRGTSKGVTQYPSYSALGWLQAAARGEITPNLPLIQPNTGARIRFGGNTKVVNVY